MPRKYDLNNKYKHFTAGGRRITHMSQALDKAYKVTTRFLHLEDACYSCHFIWAKDEECARKTIAKYFPNHPIIEVRFYDNAPVMTGEDYHHEYKGRRVLPEVLSEDEAPLDPDEEFKKFYAEEIAA
jgi:hypothetical protein